MKKRLRFLSLIFGSIVCLTTTLVCGVACTNRQLSLPTPLSTRAVLLESSTTHPHTVTVQTPLAEPVEARLPHTAPQATIIPIQQTVADSTRLPPETRTILTELGAQSLFNPRRGDVRLVVISDLNAAYGATDYDPEVDKGIALIPFWQPDMVIGGGDMVAGQNSALPTEQIQAMWAAFDDHVGGPLRRYAIPYGFTIGNHDGSGAQNTIGNFLFQQERELAQAYWNDPIHNPGLTFVDRFEFPFYYTFEHETAKNERIFFMAWDGSSHLIPQEKLRWVEEALGSDHAQMAKMRVVIGHLPLYGVAVGRDQPGEVLANADALRAVLERQNVHTYISGHHHAYYPGHRGDLQLLNAGILGSGPRQHIAGSLPPTKTITVVDIRFDEPDLTAYTTYDMQTLTVIDQKDLPRFLIAHNGLSLRRDVEWNDLSESEKIICHEQLGIEKCGP